MEDVTVENFFGKAGNIYPPIIKSLLEGAYNKKYDFLPLKQFEALNSVEINYVYWVEILYRAHWAATSNLIRHDKWFDACISNSVIKPNYISFCSGLRGLLESTADTYFSLGSVPLTLANSSGYIDDALGRRPAKKLAVSEELENALIHFSFARKLNKGEDSPASHRAATAGEYMSQLDSDELPIKRLYAELCQVVHPAHQSTAWVVENLGESYWVREPQDLMFISDLCQRYASCIEYIQMASVNISMFVYKAINEFDLVELINPSAKDYNMSQSPLHERMYSAFKRQRTR
ncbi:hypothetical protein [Pseudomonas sp. PDM09]|uniref:hypothetical protein n=1 Tax=Pseudomonas sp. PDM09 TaxID=2769270 RepID=UPI0017834783|nr:hypothetical protein [Pseudomonas sp. PDM09]MBD9561719.1 hypothetical protein [Pseudomonas sp. PDM09]